MPRVRMITRMAGPEGVVEPGTVVDVPEAAARIWVEMGFAEWVDAPGIASAQTTGLAMTETAEAPKAPEQAVSKRARKSARSPAARKPAARKAPAAKGGKK